MAGLETERGIISNRVKGPEFSAVSQPSSRQSLGKYPRAGTASPVPKLKLLLSYGQEGGFDFMFQIGDKAVYPGHGVGIIEAIESKQISGKEQMFFILRILENGMTIMIPRDNVEAAKLRGVIRKIDVRKVIEILKDREVTIDNQTWNRRYREYMEKINTGSIYGIAEVLRDLHLLKEEKELSFGERKIMDTAKNLLVKELAIARNVKETDILREIHSIFGS
jgi:CarD family transcriptional regulator